MPDPLQITSRANPTFQRLRRLADDGRERARAGRTLLEGDHLVGGWIERGLPVERLLVDAAFATRPMLERLVERAIDAGSEVIALPESLLRQLSTLDSPAPVLAEIAPIAGDADALAGCDVVLLDRLQDPGNVGAILRTCAAAGVGHAIAGPGTAALWSPKVLRAAMGAHAVLNLLAVDDLAATCRTLALPVYGTSSHAATPLDALLLLAPCAWVFGHEGGGLSSEMEQALTERVAIDQAPDVESLNVAAAAAVCLFEMRRQRRAQRGAPPGPVCA